METFLVYGYDTQGYYTNTLETNKYQGIPSGYTKVEIPLIPEDKFLQFNGNQWAIVDVKIYPEEVPSTITVRQAREQLIKLGLIAQVQTSIDSIADPMQKAIVQNYWEYSIDFKRDNELLISLGHGLGLTDSEIDDLFIEASKL